MRMATGETKICALCGRTITWRKKWARDWPNVKYCSDACRKKKAAPDDQFEPAILELLASRPSGKTICPSEVARARSTDHWRELMEPVREAGRRLVARGLIEVTQKNHVVDPSTAKGPIRYRLR